MESPKFNRPDRLTLEVTSHCHRGCEFCPRQWMSDKPGYMPVGYWNKLVKEAHYLKIPTLIACWRGESTLHGWLPEMINYARSRIERIELVTGATDWPKRFYDIMPKLDFLSISLHSSQQAKLINTAIHYRKTLGKPEIQLTAVEGEDTVGLLKKFIHSERENISRGKIYKRHTEGGKWGAIKGVTVDAEPSSRHEPLPCSRLSRDIVIAWNGYVSRCTHVYETERLNAVQMGIENVWNHPTWQERREVREGKPWQDTVCRQCDAGGESTPGEVIKYEYEPETD